MPLKTSSKNVFSCTILLWALLAAGPLRGGEVEPQDGISIHLDRAELLEFIRVVAQYLKVNYTVDPEVKGAVTVHSSEPLRREEVLPVFHQLLRLYGAIAVKTGDIYRISPIEKGKAPERQPVPGAKEVSQAIQIARVRYFPAKDMRRILAPLVAPGGEIGDQPQGNLLIIKETPPNIQRLMEIKGLIDIDSFIGTRMEIYQPKASSGAELAAGMRNIMHLYSSPASPPDGFVAEFIPIPGGNEILVISRHGDSVWSHARTWLDQLDSPSEKPERRIFVQPLTNGDAKELAARLNGAKPPGESRIVADPITNSLIIFATLDELRAIKSVFREEEIREFKERLSALARRIAQGKNIEKGQRL